MSFPCSAFHIACFVSHTLTLYFIHRFSVSYISFRTSVIQPQSIASKLLLLHFIEMLCFMIYCFIAFDQQMFISCRMSTIFVSCIGSLFHKLVLYFIYRFCVSHIDFPTPVLFYSRYDLLPLCVHLK